MTGKAQRQAGFTLIEMLVGMALFSFVLLCFGGLFLGLEKTSAAIGRVERSESLDLVRHYLLRSLEGSRAHSRAGADGIRRVHFAGQANRVTFVVAAAGDREVGGLYEAQIWRDTRGRLLLLHRPLGWGDNKDVAPEVLLDNLGTLSFTYYPCPSRSVRLVGVQNWLKSDELPFRISIAAAFRDGDTRVWPPLSVLIPGSNCPAAR